MSSPLKTYLNNLLHIPLTNLSESPVQNEIKNLQEYFTPIILLSISVTSIPIGEILKGYREGVATFLYIYMTRFPLFDRTDTGVITAIYEVI